MSDISVYSGLYETIRRWADLIDTAIVKLEAQSSDANDRSFAPVRSLFSGLALHGDAGADFSDRRVATIVEGQLLTKVDWQELAQKLQEPTGRTETLLALEAIAQCLANTHDDTVARMRRGLP